jgi:hypothetical protein
MCLFVSVGDDVVTQTCSYVSPVCAEIHRILPIACILQGMAAAEAIRSRGEPSYSLLIGLSKICWLLTADDQEAEDRGL